MFEIRTLSSFLIFLSAFGTSAVVSSCADSASRSDYTPDGVTEIGIDEDGALEHSDVASGPDAGAQGDSQDRTTGDGFENTGDGFEADGENGQDAENPQSLEIISQEDASPLNLTTWFIAAISNNDSVGDALDRGTFIAPLAAGPDGNGQYWSSEPANEGNTVAGGGQYFYAVTTFETADSIGLVVQADGTWDVWLNGRHLPGEPYGGGRNCQPRMPFQTQPGENTLVIRSRGGNTATVTAATTHDALYMNLADATTPHLVVGRQDDLYIGIATLNTTDEPIFSATAEIIDNDYFEATSIIHPALGAGASSQVSWHLVQKQAIEAADTQVEVTLRLTAPDLHVAYERTLTLTSLEPSSAYKRTFLSPTDGSTQYYGVREPTAVEEGSSYGLALSLHGAQVQGINQAQSYSQKDWAYVVAATNRRPFGFDWEAWGRRDGLEVLAHAKASFPVNLSRVHVTGHSMGGHGTWQFGTLMSGLFGVMGPSAGWSSFYTYGGTTKPSGAFAAARASSDTMLYLSNLTDKPVYVIHGDADDNVPISESYALVDAAQPYTSPELHVEPGAGHWWDGDASPGVDCVDWPPLFELMEATTFDPYALDFTYKTPSPSVNAVHSYVTITSCNTSYESCSLLSTSDEAGNVTLTTDNVRGLTLKGEELIARGVDILTWNGVDVTVTAEDIALGEQSGKTPEVYGPFNQVFERPFCLIYPDSGPEAYKDYAAFLLTAWSIQGNGAGCSMPLSRVTDALRAERNMVYLGVPKSEIPAAASLPISWDTNTLTIKDETHSAAAMLFVFPEGERLAAAMVATVTFEYLLFWHQPFSSRAVMPDYFMWTANNGGVVAGMAGPDWTF